MRATDEDMGHDAEPGAVKARALSALDRAVAQGVPTHGHGGHHRRGKASPLVAQLLAAIDQSARTGIRYVDDDELEAARAEVTEMVARIDHLLSITAAPGEQAIDYHAHAADAAIALGHARQLANLLRTEDSADAAAIDGALDRVATELAGAGWHWKASHANDHKKAGHGLTRNEDAQIVTVTLDVVEARIAAVRGTDDAQPLRVTTLAIADDLRHAAREARLVATEEKARRSLARAVSGFQEPLGAFRDQLAGAGLDAALPIDAVRGADLELLEAVGLPESKARWDVDGTYNVERSKQQLAELRERRVKGQTQGNDHAVPDHDQITAENEAVGASQTVLDRSKGATGVEITNIVQTLLGQITTIEEGRSAGYGHALQDVIAKAALDKEDPSTYESFGIALAGNLLWALSGILPAAPGIRVLTKGLAELFAPKWSSNDASAGVAAALGTVGAMMAQFSGGLPHAASGGAGAASLIAARDALDQANSRLCNSLRRDLYEYLATALAGAPPEKETDAARYAADLQIALRQSLFGEVFALHLNDGELPDRSKIARYARDHLLNQYVIGSATVVGGRFKATKANEGEVKLPEVIDALGGADQVQVGPFELAYNQIHAAATDLGCRVSLDMDGVKQRMERRETFTVPVTGFDPKVAWADRLPTAAQSPDHPYTKWILLRAKGVIDSRDIPEIIAGQMISRHVAGITEIEIRKEDIESSKLSDKTVFTVANLHFHARGQGRIDDPWPADQIGDAFDMPATFDIEYHVKP